MLASDRNLRHLFASKFDALVFKRLGVLQDQLKWEYDGVVEARAMSFSANRSFEV